MSKVSLFQMILYFNLKAYTWFYGNDATALPQHYIAETPIARYAGADMKELSFIRLSFFT
jgi:hypothetical protein